MTPLARRRLKRALRSEWTIDLLVGAMIAATIALLMLLGLQIW